MPSKPETRALVAAVIAGTMIVYASTGPLTVQEADSGLFLLLAKFGGHAHPPGYPLYVMAVQVAARLFSFLPLVFAVSMVSIIAASLSAGLFFLISLEISGSVLPSLLATGVCFFSTAVWRTATSLEPFGLNLLLVMSVLWCCLRLCRDPQRLRPWAVLGLVGGLGVCNHHTLILLAPMGICALPALISHRRQGWRPLALFGCFFIVGLLPLVQLVFPSGAGLLAWDNIDTFSNLWRRLTRASYGTFQLAATSTGSRGEMILFFFKNLPNELSYGGLLLLVLAPVGVWGISRRRKGVAFFGIGLFFTSMLVVFVFFGLFNVALRDADASMIAYRFVHVALLPIGLLMVFGAAVLLRPGSHASAMATGMVSIFLIFHVMTQYPTADRRHETFMEWDIINVFRSVESAAKPLIITFGDADSFGFLYGKYVLGLGKQVEMFHPSTLPMPKYRARIARQLGVEPEILNRKWSLTADDFSARYQVFLSRPQLSSTHPLFKRVYPYGRLARVVAKGQPTPSWDEVFQLNSRVFAWDFHLPYYEYNGWERAAFERYAVVQRMFGKPHRNQAIADFRAASIKH